MSNDINDAWPDQSEPCFDGFCLSFLFVVCANGYSFLIEILFLVQSRGWKVGETPTMFEDRREGISKISRKEIAKAVYTVVRLFAQRGRVRAGTPRPATSIDRTA